MCRMGKHGNSGTNVKGFVAMPEEAFKHLLAVFERMDLLPAAQSDDTLRYLLELLQHMRAIRRRIGP